jgi:hypothetical protein
MEPTVCYDVGEWVNDFLKRDLKLNNDELAGFRNLQTRLTDLLPLIQ